MSSVDCGWFGNIVKRLSVTDLGTSGGDERGFKKDN
jgi:hypothetical protein